MAERWLVDGEDEVDGLLRTVLGPVVVNLVMDEAEHVQRVAEVDEAVGLVGLGIVFVSRQLQVVKVVLVVFLEIGQDFFVRVPARNILNHQVGPGLFAAQDLIHVNGASIVLARC